MQPDEAPCETVLMNTSQFSTLLLSCYLAKSQTPAVKTEVSLFIYFSSQNFERYPLNLGVSFIFSLTLEL